MADDRASEDDRHDFGGPWTELKLNALDEYSQFFTVALKNQKFELWYIDPFAGTGTRVAKKQTGGLLEGVPVAIEEEILAGSARRALSVTPHFHHLVLSDRRPKHFKALCALAEEHPDRDIRPFNTDANDQIKRLFTSPPWMDSPKSSAQRALVFLDPYGMNVQWETLELLAKSQRADVWMLVNLKAVCQQLAHDHDRLDQSKRNALSKFFGTNEWEDQFYKFSDNQRDLFSIQPRQSGHRSVSRTDVARFYRLRLNTRFKYVSEPLPLKVNSQESYFQLYCMSNNPSHSARSLIARGAEAVIKKYKLASHRRYDH
ncbi:three-Cys-motif partner protein TcmP [Sphingobium sp. AN558]|uniref:three-Cys-motif partner protein TcmP n=1 Tax=Sphingobium sp. AN558 TaxID=3133442 RepID=UPI0030BFE128